MQDHDSTVRPILATVETIEFEEVVPVIRHERALGGRCVLEQVPIGQSAKLASLADGFDIARPFAKLPCHHGRDHLVEQQLHCVRLCSRQRRSAASASS
jgi:hypothetical protein